MGLAKILLGTSGWSYEDWVGVFYRSSNESKLYRYSRTFETVEIDSTFYSYPDPRVIASMEKVVPENFIFSAKVPRLITHKKRLSLSEGIEEDLNRFLEILRPLSNSGKLGVLLIQLPPSFTYDKHEDLLKNFLKILPNDYRFAVEFRDPSWLRENSLNLLSRYEVAYTIVDEPLLPPELHVTTDFSYVRWHGRGVNPWYNYHYSREGLEPWKDKLNELSDKVDVIYGYFNNHFHGYAVHNCLQVLEILGIITPAQKEILEEVEKNLAKPAKTVESLSIYISPEKLPSNLRDLLKILVSESRLRRAEKMDKNLIKILERSEKYLSAEVKEYGVIMDLDRRLILHDCADWERIRVEFKLCKHIAALLLNLDEDYAKNILKDIIMNRGLWNFERLERSGGTFSNS